MHYIKSKLFFSQNILIVPMLFFLIYYFISLYYYLFLLNLILIYLCLRFVWYILCTTIDVFITFVCIIGSMFTESMLILVADTRWFIRIVRLAIVMWIMLRNYYTILFLRMVSLLAYMYQYCYFNYFLILYFFDL